MQSPQTPDERARDLARLTKLRSFAVLDTDPEEAFDAIAELAADVLDSPIALISLLDEGRQWFKAKVGTTATGSSLRDSFCVHTLVERERFVVEDATNDERFKDSIFVRGETQARAYAGAPLITSDGEVLGTVCVLDTVPREFTARQLTNLDRLAAHTIRLLEMRRAALSTREGESLMRKIYVAAQNGESLDDRICSALQVGCEWLKMDVGIASRITGELYTIGHIVGAEPPRVAGATFAVGDSFCRFVAESPEPLAVADASDGMVVEHPAYPRNGARAFIGVRVLVDGEVYGTLNFTSRSPRAEPFTDLDSDLLQLMAVWIGAEVGREIAAKRLAELAGELNAKTNRLQTLEAILPICSWCDSVRDDEGSWSGLEDYVLEHSNARFSHGICPSCFDKKEYEK